MDNNREVFEKIILAALKACALQMRIGSIAMEAALTFGTAKLLPRGAAGASPEPLSERQIDAAARILKAEIIGCCDVGFQGLLRANFSDDRIRQMAKEALEAASESIQE